MADPINIDQYIDIAAGFILLNLLHDSCNIYPLTRTSDGSGGYDEGLGSPRTYAGSMAIPCRLDPTRQYRDQDIFNQEITVTDYNANFPRDSTIMIDDVVMHNGITYQIKKLTDDNTWKSIKKAYLVSVR